MKGDRNVVASREGRNGGRVAASPLTRSGLDGLLTAVTVARGTVAPSLTHCATRVDVIPLVRRTCTAVINRLSLTPCSVPSRSGRALLVLTADVEAAPLMAVRTGGVADRGGRSGQARGERLG